MSGINQMLTALTIVMATGTTVLGAPQAHEGYADLPGVRLWYTDTASTGVPVVLLHANTGNSESWQYNVPAFEKEGYRVITFDRRGWGRSMANPSTGPQPGTVAEDLHGLANLLKLERFHLVGIAGGGFVALDYALTHPDRLVSLVVAASTGAVADPMLAEMFARSHPPEFNRLAPQFREISFGYLATQPDGLKKWLDINSRSQQPGAPPQRQLVEKTLAKLETIKTPTLLLPADSDLTAPPYIMRTLSTHIPGSELQLIPEAGHSANWEQPEIFNRLVLEFLSRRSQQK